MSNSKTNKIYTKTGDNGETSLLGGRRVPKFHPRVEAYGNIDELNSYIGLIRSLVEQKHTYNVLLKIQHHLYFMASLVACDSCKEQEKLTQIDDKDISFLEKEMDSMTKKLPELTAFIIPGGNVLVSYTHIARCVCRRAERLIIQLSAKTFIDKQIIIYLNRLSDFLFTLARQLSKNTGAEELKYNK